MVKFITHKNKQILLLDVSDIKDVETSIAEFDKAQQIIEMQPKKSVLLLTNVSNTHYNKKATDRLKNFSIAITPYVKASATFGLTGIMKIIVNSLTRLSKREIKIFDNIEDAKNWLIEQSDD